MKAESGFLWQRALRAAASVKVLLADGDPDGASSKAYYAAFHAVSALFALKGRFFSKHSAVEDAVHRELVNSGVWPKELGRFYSLLRELRQVGDYDRLTSVSVEKAHKALEAATRIIEAVHRLASDEFPLPESWPRA
ncbi:MAG: HEPN domain-containing protein [Thermodesulfobacteriota bacterium]